MRLLLKSGEKLEQLRWIENGCRIAVAFTERPSFGIDTPADLARAEEENEKISCRQSPIYG